MVLCQKTQENVNQVLREMMVQLVIYAPQFNMSLMDHLSISIQTELLTEDQKTRIRVSVVLQATQALITIENALIWFQITYFIQTVSSSTPLSLPLHFKLLIGCSQDKQIKPTVFVIQEPHHIVCQLQTKIGRIFMLLTKA